ncbi:hypothetical protein HOA92_04770 [archaeon]|jgi:hypothetical protein|nr:hypothetical protein [archaeon]MBT6762330.1 hypothetical protein [archaeon]
MKKTIIVLLLVSLTALVLSSCTQTTQITNFTECIAAGNPAMESYPRQCRDATTGNSFTEIIVNSWDTDSIELRQHETEGSYGCFGCSEAGITPALCVDPIMEMKSVKETPALHCDENFELVQNDITECTFEQRDVDGCIEIFSPVCATVNVQCVTTPCDPVYETFDNYCFACTNSFVSDYVEGEC